VTLDLDALKTSPTNDSKAVGTNTQIHFDFGKPTSGILVNTVRTSANNCPLNVTTFPHSLLKYSDGADEVVDGMEGNSRSYSRLSLIVNRRVSSYATSISPSLIEGSRLRIQNPSKSRKKYDTFMTYLTRAAVPRSSSATVVSSFECTRLPITSLDSPRW
jgi:hypothetical protein